MCPCPGATSSPTADRRPPTADRRPPTADRRPPTADRRRLAAGVVGVSLAVMLVLLLDGMWVGLQRQATVYTEKAGADPTSCNPACGTVPA